MKVVFYTASNAQVQICEVSLPTVRATVLNEKRISLSSAEIQAQCPNLPAGDSWATILPQNNIWANDPAEFHGWFAGIFPVKVTKIENTTSVALDASKGDIFGNVKNGKPLVLWGNAGEIGGCDQNDSPLIVSLNRTGGAPTKLKLSAPLDGILFDILGLRSFPFAHNKRRISWFENSQVARDNYFVVLPNARGEVNGIEEMFGNNTSGPDRGFADDGYEALRKWDGLRSNGKYNARARDGFITADDDVFTKLRLWSDENLDGVAQSHELFTLDEMGVESIDLDYDQNYKEVDKYYNEIKMKSSVKMKDGSLNMIYDLWFRTL